MKVLIVFAVLIIAVVYLLCSDPNRRLKRVLNELGEGKYNIEVIAMGLPDLTPALPYFYIRILGDESNNKYDIGFGRIELGEESFVPHIVTETEKNGKVVIKKVVLTQELYGKAMKTIEDAREYAKHPIQG